MATSTLTPVLEALEARTLRAAVTPTAYEQYMVELINRARMNPAAEAQRYNITINEGLAPGTISNAAKQPVAINPYLTDSARGHSEWERTTGTFSHTGANNSDPGTRMAAAGYGNSTGWTENIALSLQSSQPNVSAKVDSQHNSLFVDQTIDGRWHRVNMMNAGMKEVGVGIGTGPMNYNGVTYNSVLSTQDFATQGGNSFLTGVAYNDSAVWANAFYTPGEGLGGATVTATRTADNQQFSTTTWASGGYSLQLAPGTYNVQASGGGLASTIYYNQVTIGSQNVKKDFLFGQSADAAPSAGSGNTGGGTPTPTPIPLPPAPTPPPVVPTGASFAVVSNRLLTVNGTTDNDVIDVSQGGGKVVAKLNGVPMAFSSSEIDTVWIFGNDGNDLIALGDDVPATYINGGNGKDTLIGSNGNDTLTGGAQADSIGGGDGDDRINGTGGNDILLGGNGDDRIYGGSGDDWIEGHGGVDRVWGGDGNDTITGGSGYDKLFGGNGNDALYGQDGNDRLYGQAGTDYINGGGGYDASEYDLLDTRVAIAVLI